MWIALALALGGGFGVLAYLDAQEAARQQEARRAREERRRARERQRAEVLRAAREESRRVVPEILEGVAIGMGIEELRAVRRAARGSDVERRAAERWFEETLSNGAQVLYGFTDDRLVMLQVLSRIDPRGVGPHLTAMRERYGTPTGVYRCSAQSAAGVPTLRFLWRRSHLTVQDIFLIHAGGVSVTLYIAPTDRVAGSLQVAGCRPVRSREELGELPFATPEMLEGRETPGRR